MITNRHRLEGLTSALSETSEYTPGKVFDTVADATSGDTILASKTLQTDLGALESAAENLSEELAEFGHDDGPEFVSYAQTAQRRLAELAFVRQAIAQQTGDVDNSNAIRESQELLHSYYDPALYKAALKQKIALLEAVPVPHDGLDEAQAILLDKLENYADRVDVDDIELETPRQETLDAIGAWIANQFGDVFDEIDSMESNTLNAEQLQYVMNMAIDTTPALRDNGWEAEKIRRNKQAISTMASRRRVVVPEGREATKEVAKNLVVHEVFGHALRSAIAETDGNDIGVTGTATYSTFEESFEIALEQCRTGKYNPNRGLDHYIAIGLVETSGLSRDEAATVINSMRQINLAKGGLSQDDIAKADRLTKSQIARTFAGMVDTDDGIANRKDAVYLHGLNGAWKILNAIVAADQVDEGMRWLLQAKFNPYDKSDVNLVGRYSEIPSSVADMLDA